MTTAAELQERWPTLATVPPALAWLSMRADLGLAPRTLDAYARALSEYVTFSAASGVDSLLASREHIARFVHHLTDRPLWRASVVLGSAGCPRLANATIQRITAVRQFYDYLVEGGLRDSNPVGRGRYARAIHDRGNRRGRSRARRACLGSRTTTSGALSWTQHGASRSATVFYAGARL